MAMSGVEEFGPLQVYLFTDVEETRLSEHTVRNLSASAEEAGRPLELGGHHGCVGDEAADAGRKRTGPDEAISLLRK